MDGTIYFGSHDNKCYALAPDGNKKWEYATGGPIISSPALGQDGSVYFTSVDGSFFALNPEGTLRWRLRTGGFTESSPVIGPDGTIYFGVNQEFWAVTPEGNKKWARGVEELIEATPLVLADASICFEGGYHIMFNTGADTTVNWIYVGLNHGSPSVAPSGAIYVSDSTQFKAIRSHTPLARSPWPKFRGNARNTGNARDCVSPGH